MNERTITPMTYLHEMAAMSWKHSWELTAATACAAAAVTAALVMRSHGPAIVLFVLLSAAVLLFEAAAAAWRLHRRQGVALATTRSLLGLNAADRTDLERHLRTRYRRREARIEERNAARLERLAREIDALQAEVLGRSHRRVAL